MSYKLGKRGVGSSVRAGILAATAAIAIAAGVVALHPSKVSAAGGKYELVEHWGQLPAGTTWGVMSAVGVDSKDNVYVFQRSDPDAKIMVFDSHGKLLRTFGEGTFTYPHGLRVLRDDHVWATDREMQQILEYDLQGKLLMTIGKKGVKGDANSTDLFNGVSDVVMAANGDLFASDGEGGNNRIVKMSKDGKFIKAWGTKGAGPGQLNVPHAISMDPKGNVWVADRGNRRLQVFDQDGKFLNEFSQFGPPASVIISKDGLVYCATPVPENKVTIGTLDGKILETIEGINSAHGIAVDSTGAIYVSESAGKEVRKYIRK